MEDNWRDRDLASCYDELGGSRTNEELRQRASCPEKVAVRETHVHGHFHCTKLRTNYRLHHALESTRFHQSNLQSMHRYLVSCNLPASSYRDCARCSLHEKVCGKCCCSANPFRKSQRKHAFNAVRVMSTPPDTLAHALLEHK